MISNDSLKPQKKSELNEYFSLNFESYGLCLLSHLKEIY